MIIQKKGSGLSMQTIVVAALALTVLIVLILILTGRFGDLQQNTGTCASQGGVCASELPDGKCTSEFPIQMWKQDCECVKDTVSDSFDFNNCEKNKRGQCCLPLGS
jgi:hypothetical protein